MGSYVFSIIIPVYNVERYLDETIMSVLNQKFDQSKVEIILIDDGSSDKSPEICDKYSKQNSNIKVIHKNNEGVSVARNQGIMIATGKYVGFLDSDDMLSDSTLETVYRFFEQNHDSTDVVAIPRYYFDGRVGETALNYKFDKGSRIIDLTKEYTMIQNIVTSTFFKLDSIKNIVFDSELKYGEDTKYIIEVLEKNKKMGVVTGCKYYYRKRRNGPQSAVDSMYSNPDWYMAPLNRLTKHTIEKYVTNNVNVPNFIQYTLMFELSWKIRIEHIDSNILTTEEYENYKKTVKLLMRYISTKVIMAQSLLTEHKLFLLKLKYDKDPDIDKVGDEIRFNYKNKCVHKLSLNRVILDKITVEGNIIEIEGSYISVPPSNKIQFITKVDNKKIKHKVIKRQLSRYSLDTLIRNGNGFKIRVSKFSKKIEFFYSYDGIEIKCKNIQSGKYFPILMDGTHYSCNGVYVCFENKSLRIHQPTKNTIAKYNIMSFLKIRDWKDFKIFTARILLSIYRKINKKIIVMISDRINKADDCGEVFFKYLQSKSDIIESYFVISANSQDYLRMKKYGNVIEYRSLKHKLLFYLSKYYISSHADHEMLFPIGNEEKQLALGRPKFIFLQHGVTKDDISKWLNKYNHDIHSITVSSEKEKQSFLIDTYNYSEKNLWLTGMARFDALVSNPKKIITIMPTWRRMFVSSTNDDGSRTIKSECKKSTFFKIYSELLQTKELFDIAESNGYKIAIMYHPNMITLTDIMPHDDRLIVHSINKSYSEIFSESNLVISDYSSITFDFAYLKKPVIYFQPDIDEFFSGTHTYVKGYFSYESDGFGEIEYTIDGLVSRINEYISNNCEMKEEYIKRVDNFYLYNDKNNCERIYNKLIDDINNS